MQTTSSPSNEKTTGETEKFHANNINMDNFIDSLPENVQTAFVGLPTMRINDGIRNYGLNSATVSYYEDGHNRSDTIHEIRVSIDSPACKGIFVISHKHDDIYGIRIESRNSPVFMSKMTEKQASEYFANLFPHPLLEAQNSFKKRFESVRKAGIVPSIVIDMVADGRLTINETQSTNQKLHIDIADGHGYFEVYAKNSENDIYVYLKNVTANPTKIDSEEFIGILSEILGKWGKINQHTLEEIHRSVLLQKYGKT